MIMTYIAPRNTLLVVLLNLLVVLIGKECLIVYGFVEPSPSLRCSRLAIIRGPTPHNNKRQKIIRLGDDDESKSLSSGRRHHHKWWRRERRLQVLFGTTNIISFSRLFRLVAFIGIIIIGSFFVYLAGTAILNRTLVNVFGVSRSGDAFGPFVTILSLIYSIVLGQIYHYYFERQGVIQNCLYEEVASLQLLYHAINKKILSSRRRHHRHTGRPQFAEKNEEEPSSQDDNVSLLLAPLKSYCQNLIDSAFTKEASRILNDDDTRKLMDVTDILAVDDNNNSKKEGDDDEHSSSFSSTITSTISSTHHLIVSNTIQDIIRSRALRVSAVNSELPRVQKITERLLSYVILFGFVLVDLQAPILEALLFSVICGCFTTIHVFLVDLSDPFSGEWTVGAHIRKDLDILINKM